MNGQLILKDGTHISGESFGAPVGTAGEVVFATGMTGYPQAFTDPSFAGQILVMTYPIIGSYGIPSKSFWESEKLQISGLIVSDYIDTPSHADSKMTLSKWLQKENIPSLIIKDTRFLTQHLRNKGTMLGKIEFGKIMPFFDPNKINLVEQVSIKKITKIGNPSPNSEKRKTVVLIDCGGKYNIEKCFINRDVNVVKVPWDFDPFTEKIDFKFDALFISNGPGDPKKADKTIATIKKSMENKIPTLGICLGNQLLALAGGGDTKKMKFGHRSQNQPCLLKKSNRCYITTQNHGFAVNELPTGFSPWFVNANDESIEGIIHNKHPFMSVQFHPEATPGPKDTEWIFDYFLEKI